MKKLYIFLVATLLSVSLVLSQNRETREISSFDEIEVSEAISVEIKKGNSPQVIVEIRGSADLDDVITEVRGSTLEIEMKDRMGGYRNVDVYVYVTYTELSEIEVNSAANLYSEGVIAAKSLEIKVSSAGDAKVEVEVDELEVNVSSAGDLEVSGSADRQFVRVSSSGDYDAYDLKSRTAEVDASSSGDAKIYVNETLEADASSAGSVYYQGNPEKVIADSSSGGKVRKS